MANRRNQDQEQFPNQTDDSDNYDTQSTGEGGGIWGRRNQGPASYPGIIDEGRLYRSDLSGPNRHDHERSHRYNQQQRFENEASPSDVNNRYRGGASYYNQSRNLPDYQSNQGVRGLMEDAEKNHSGKGPKGYRRADSRIREDVSEILYRDPRIDASEIEVDVKDGVVTLFGLVENRRIKRLAEDVVEKCHGVRDVINQLRLGSGGIPASTPESIASSTNSNPKSIQ